MKKTIITLCLYAAGSLALPAQEVYTLQQCLEKGLENNYDLRILRNDEQAAKNNATLANAGYLPTLDLSAGWSSTFDNTDTQARSTGETTSQRDVFDQTLRAGVNLNWTLFDGFNISTTYKKLKELERIGETNTRIAVSDFIADLSIEYYNYVQQQIRLKNFLYAVMLSKERLRVAEERYHIGSSSGLDYQQAKVDFNADSAQYMKQQELVVTSRINLNLLMASKEMNRKLHVQDTSIVVNQGLNFDELMKSTLTNNDNLVRAKQNTKIAELNYRRVLSRNYPSLKLNAGYGYTHNKYDISSTQSRDNWGLNGGLTLGFNLWDGNRHREKQNARIEVRNAQLTVEQLEQRMKAELSNEWHSYTNSLQLVRLERQNLITAHDNHEVAQYRYLKGDLSGIEMREAQKSLFDAEERLLSAQYNAKVCEIYLLLISGNMGSYLK